MWLWTLVLIHRNLAESIMTNLPSIYLECKSGYIFHRHERRNDQCWDSEASACIFSFAYESSIVCSSCSLVALNERQKKTDSLSLSFSVAHRERVVDWTSSCFHWHMLIGFSISSVNTHRPGRCVRLSVIPNITLRETSSNAVFFPRAMLLTFSNLNVSH